jgi:hypothetical protein
MQNCKQKRKLRHFIGQSAITHVAIYTFSEIRGTGHFNRTPEM